MEKFASFFITGDFPSTISRAEAIFRDTSALRTSVKTTMLEILQEVKERMIKYTKVLKGQYAIVTDHSSQVDISQIFEANQNDYFNEVDTELFNLNCRAVTSYLSNFNKQISFVVGLLGHLILGNKLL